MLLGVLQSGMGSFEPVEQFTFPTEAGSIAMGVSQNIQH